MVTHVFEGGCSAIEAYLALRADRAQTVIEDTRKNPDKALHQHLKSCLVHNMNWMMRGGALEERVDVTSRIDFKDAWAIRGLLKRYNLDGGRPPVLSEREYAFVNLIEDRRIKYITDEQLCQNIAEIVEAINNQHAFIKLFGPCSHPLVKMLRYQVGQFVETHGHVPSCLANSIQSKKGGPTAAVKTGKGIILISLDAHKHVG